MEKNKQTETIDPYAACIEIVMLDIEVRIHVLHCKGLKPNYLECVLKLRKEGHWESQWLLGEYALVLSKLSRQRRKMRDFIEFIGDRATMMWMDNEARANDNLGAKPSKEGQN